ncbi:MAG: MFS transporter [Calditrichaeota bacterium]|nr:MAG: MFS transporter [Calditrichota bacterium]MBL1207419.1 MFS transporter [Calditrichota bacterium]NOG47251.1 MFS transporter [Calditrichota bacterium]
MSDSLKPTPLFPILLVNFIGMLGFSIVLPFLVFLVTDFGGNAFIYGLVGAMYPGLQLIGAPILGRLSDKYGRRKILLVSQAGTLLSWVIFLSAFFIPVEPLLEYSSSITGSFVLTWPLIIVFFARAFDGLTGGNIAVANAYLADITPPEKRNVNFGKMGISFSLGFIVGPALAGLLGALGYGNHLPVIAALLISFIAVFLIYFYLPESNGKSKGDYQQKEKPTIGFILRLPHIGYMLGMYFMVFLGFHLFYTAFPVHAIENLNWDVSQTGIFFTIMSTIMVVVQGPILKSVSSKVKEPILIIFGGIILGTNFLLYFPSNTAITYFAVILFSLGNGLMWPSVQAFLSKITPAEHQGVVQGFAGSFGSLAGVIGLIAGGFFYSSLSTDVFIFSAVIIYFVAIMAIRLLKIETQ